MRSSVFSSLLVLSVSLGRADFLSSLTEADRRLKFQQLADNKIRLIQEQEELEQKQFELFFPWV